MDRILRVDRLYNLGDFKSLRVGEVIDGSRRVSDEISGISEELWFNSEFIDKLRYLQLIQMDEVYFKYVEHFINRFHSGRKAEEVPQIIEELNELKLETIAELKDIINTGDK